MSVLILMEESIRYSLTETMLKLKRYDNKICVRI